ncbi:DJ-1/PfpI family protein [Aliiroseovarius halocynthiae]|uniref:Glutamine amidotransferase n=1 Tax=Aliiroseovarius halocynthiae TaxID=985055 RepID=A0A545SZN1_9RHOB|nr:DJ-1/PfpI family protein [Aliiroseovarius halocynthiae]TQV70434.1 glutamine amidotransferase [Aliiroseovarius halocynthiae]SMR81849.1 DJ-1/PfpI family protein [Aliiroseovarius halocynthiae]
MTKIAILLIDGFADWEYGLVGGTAGPFYALDLRYFTPKHGQVRSQGGLIAMVEDGLQTLADWQPDVIAVIGSAKWEQDAPDIAALLQQEHARGAHIAGICGGTLALARAGLLNAAAHTSNAAGYLSEHAVGYSGASHYVDSPAAVSDNRITTAPGTAPVTFAIEMFKAASVPEEAIQHFQTMLTAEHGQ